MIYNRGIDKILFMEYVRNDIDKTWSGKISTFYPINTVCSRLLIHFLSILLVIKL